MPMPCGFQQGTKHILTLMSTDAGGLYFQVAKTDRLSNKFDLCSVKSFL